MSHRRISADGNRLSGSAWIGHRLEPLIRGFQLWGAIFITVLDVFLLLGIMKLGFKKIEAIVSTLILTILLIFVYLVALAEPSISGIFTGFLPTAQLFEPTAPGHDSILTLALGIVGATVMPHNLYLHSSLSQTRKVDYTDPDNVRKAVRFMTWDSNIQLSLAFVVNSLLLILGAALFSDTPLKSLPSRKCTMPFRTLRLLVRLLVQHFNSLCLGTLG